MSKIPYFKFVLLLRDVVYGLGVSKLWANDLTFLGFSFFVFQVVVITVPYALVMRLSKLLYLLSTKKEAKCS